MLDKLLLNNQLLVNKKKVRQAKINVINKLVKKIRRLKHIIEKKPDNTKLKKKLEKCSEILAAIKKIQSVDILKKSLTNEKNPNSVITNGEGCPEEIANALLFAHKSISDVTKTLRELLHLDDERNPGWRNEIQELSKRKKKSLSTNKKARRTKINQRKEKSVRNSRNNDWIEQPTDRTDNEGEKEEISEYRSNTSGWEVNQTDDNEEKPQTLSEKFTVMKPTKKNNNVRDKIVKQAPPKDSSNAELALRTVDPFFVTKTGDNYLSTVVIDRVQPEQPNDGMVRRERRQQAFGNSGKNWKTKTKNNFNNSKKYTKPLSNMLSLPRNIKEKTSNNEELHPSWAAKRKQKSLQIFEGKKIKFGDDDGEIESSQLKSSSERNFNKSKISKSVEISEKLHPSWEAKQKMKPTISEFKGKKIVFNDDE